MTYTVRKQSPRSWGIYDRAGTLVEGGFFARDNALTACDQWNAGTRQD
jgi:hypothetical protein